MDMATAPAVDTDKLNAFIGKFVGDLGATLHAGMVVIGEELGLYRALGKGPLTSQQLAEATATDERYVREWLSSQAAGGYVSYDKDKSTFSLTPEQALTLAQEDSAAYLPGAFMLALARSKPSRASPSRSGAAPAWAGTSTTAACSAEPKNSSGRVTPAT